MTEGQEVDGSMDTVDVLIHTDRRRERQSQTLTDSFAGVGGWTRREE